MIILTQNADIIVAEYKQIWCNKKHIYADDGILLGCYDSEERAMSVLKYMYVLMTSGGKKYRMPEE